MLSDHVPPLRPALLCAAVCALLFVSAALHAEVAAPPCTLAGVDPSSVATTRDTILFVTTRAREPNARYGSRAGPLRYGLSIITLEEERRGSFYEGMDTPYCMRKQDVALSRDAFYAYLRHRLTQRGPWSHSAVLYIHGFLNGHDASLRRTAEIKHRLRYDGSMVVFSWPATTGVTPTPARYAHDRAMAIREARSLRTVLQALAAIEPGRTSIVAHSLGSEMLTHALGSPVAGERFRSISFLAPDVSRTDFRTRSVPSAVREARRVTLYAIHGDRALQSSRLRSWLARSGAGPRAGEVASGGALTAPGLETLDMTGLQSIWHTSMWGVRHSLHLEGRALYDLLWNVTRDMPARCRAVRGLAVEEDGVWKITSDDEEEEHVLPDLPSECLLRPDSLRAPLKMAFFMEGPVPAVARRVEEAFASLRLGTPSSQSSAESGWVRLGPLGEHLAVVRAELRGSGSRTYVELAGEETEAEEGPERGDVPLTRMDFLLRQVEGRLFPLPADGR